MKIVQFQDELDDCISKYEKSIRALNKEVDDFNESNDLINKDIDLAKKQYTEKTYSELKCFKCNKKLIGLRFFMFPCKHIFDLECLIETYWEFEVNKLGDDKFRAKVKIINALSNKINDL